MLEVIKKGLWFIAVGVFGFMCYWGPELYQDWKFVHNVRIQSQLQDAARVLINQAQQPK